MTLSVSNDVIEGGGCIQLYQIQMSVQVCSEINSFLAEVGVKGEMIFKSIT